VIGLDRSIPASPLIAAAAWVDEGAGVAAASVRLTIRAEADPPLELLLQARPTPDAEWATAPLDVGRGWVAWPSGASELTVVALRAGGSAYWEYRAAIRLADGRLSGFSDTAIITG
jgi:hypothetical protein